MAGIGGRLVKEICPFRIGRLAKADHLELQLGFDIGDIRVAVCRFAVGGQDGHDPFIKAVKGMCVPPVRAALKKRKFRAAEAARNRGFLINPR